MLWSLSKDIKSLGKPKRLYKFHDNIILKSDSGIKKDGETVGTSQVK